MADLSYQDALFPPSKSLHEIGGKPGVAPLAPGDVIVSQEDKKVSHSLSGLDCTSVLSGPILSLP